MSNGNVKHAMKLLVNGDSFAAGDGLLPPGDRGPWTINKHGSYGLANGWPSMIAGRLGCQLSNLSIGLGSNDRMVRTTMDHIIRKGADGVVAVFVWTDPWRREVHCLEHPIEHGLEKDIRWRKLATGCSNMHDVPHGVKWYERSMMYGWDHVESGIRFYQQVILLSTWLRSIGVRYLHMTSITSPERDLMMKPEGKYGKDQLVHLHGAVDWSDWMRYDGSVDNVQMRISKEHGLSLPCQHPSREGHVLLASMIHDELASRGMI
jgi:hypothetical protein